MEELPGPLLCLPQAWEPAGPEPRASGEQEPGDPGMSQETLGALPAKPISRVCPCLHLCLQLSKTLSLSQGQVMGHQAHFQEKKTEA